MASTKRPLVLTVLDGWGYRAETANNAIALARKPNYDKLLREFPNTLIQASDHFVGLPDGQMGNSEVGHLNIGAGRIVYQDLVRINRAAASGELAANPVIRAALDKAKDVAGINGPLSFTPDNHIGQDHRGIVMMQFKGGRFVSVDKE